MTEPEEQPTVDHDARTMETQYSKGVPGRTTVADELPARLPDKIGPYRIKRVIAAGGMGVVYEAMQEHPRRTVALKIMKQGIASRSALRRFEYESQILARLRHPGIAQVYDAGMHDDGTGGVPYFALEYIAGARDVCDYASAKELSTRERLELFDKVCDAVHHGHQKGIIHRDLKPANILVDSTGQPKIIDFGVARATDSDLAMPTLQTDVGQLIGTVQYMSPEQIDADPHDIDTRSDVYALGVVLYKMLTDELPYDVSGAVLHEATRMIQEQQPKRPSTVAKTLRGDVETIVLHALEKDRDRRYQSAVELASDIRRYLNNRPIIARPPSVAYHFKTFVRRNKLAVGAIAAVFLALVTGVVGTTWQWKRADEQTQLVAGQKKLVEEQKALAEMQRDRAERMFEQVRSIAHTFMFDFHDEIQHLDGALIARKMLVESALRYLDGLTKDAADNPELMREVAQAYNRVGDLTGGFRNPSLGDTDGAIANYRKALTIQTSLVETDPDDTELLNEVAATNIRIGDIQKRTGDLASALVSYQEALAARERICETVPDDNGYLRMLSISLNVIGSAQVRTGQFNEALDNYERSLGIAQRLANSDTDNDTVRRRFQRDLSVVYGLLAGAHQEIGEFDAALRRFRQMLRIREGIAQKYPDSGRARRDVGITHFFIARMSLDTDQPEQAREHAEHFLAASIEGYEGNPKDWRYANDLGTAHQTMGRTLAGRDSDRAMSHFDQSVEILDRLSAEHPEIVLTRDMLATTYASRAELKSGVGATEAAIEDYQQALSIADSLASEDPNDLAAREHQASIIYGLATALIASGEREQGEYQLESARERFDQMLGEQPRKASLKEGLVDTLCELSTLMADLRDRRAASRYAEQAVQVAGEPRPVVLRVLARARHLNGDSAGAIQAAEQALNLLGDGERDGSARSTQVREQLEADLAVYRTGS